MGLMQGIKQHFKDRVLDVRLPRAYRAAQGSPVDPRKVLFVEPSQERVPESSRLVFEQLEANPDFDPVFFPLHRGQGLAVYRSRCLELAREAATARAIFLTDGSDVVSALPIRPETRVVQLWHACGAFKKWGYATADLEFGGTREELDRHPLYKNLSLVTVSAPEVVPHYEQAMGLEGQDVVRPVGVSRTDVFFDEDFVDAAKRRVVDAVEGALPDAGKKRLVLYAPTFRGRRLEQAVAPKMPDLRVLREALEQDSVVLVHQHPATPALGLGDVSAGFAADVSHLPAADVLAAADVLVTDYSSVIFDYSLLGRPMVFFAPDLEAYQRERSFFYNYEAFVPGVACTTAKQLATQLVQLQAGFDKARVDEFRGRFMGACDGHATSRILEEVLG